MRVIAMVACVATIFTIGAPEARAQDVAYGVKGGLTFATLQVEAAGEGSAPGPRAGLVVGGFLTRTLAGRFGIQPELLFTKKGASWEEDGGTATQKLDYLDVPVLVSYRLFGEPGRHVAAFVGPSFGLRLRAKSAASFGSDTLEQDVSDQVERTELALVGGIGYQRGRLVVDGRYSWGISDIDRERDDDVAVRNRGLTFLLGLQF